MGNLVKMFILLSLSFGLPGLESSIEGIKGKASFSTLSLQEGFPMVLEFNIHFGRMTIYTPEI